MEGVIHELSSVAPLPRYNLWAVPPTQVSVKKNDEVEVRPIAPVTATAPWEFVVTTAPNQYVYLNETYLKVKATFKFKEGANYLATSTWATKKIQRVNNLLHSMIKSVELTLGQKNVQQTPQHYPYRAYFETLLFNSEPAKNSTLKLRGWDNTNSVSKLTVDASGSTTDSVTFELMAPLHTDLTFQEKAILGGTPIKIKIIPNEPSFYLNYPTGATPEVTFDHVSLFVAYQQVSAELLQAHASALHTAPAKYPITRFEMTYDVIPANQTEHNYDNVFTGRLPRRVFVALVNSDAMNGSTADNTDPFKFEPHGLKFACMYINGVQFPSIPYRPDFSTEKKEYGREYLEFMRALEQHGSRPMLKIDKETFGKNCCLIPFNLAQDASSGYHTEGYVNPYQNGVMRLYLQFSSALTKNTNVLLFSEYDDVIEIDELRHVTTSYN